MHYLLVYELADDYLARRAEFRTQHLQLAREAHARGELLLAGALDEPADKAVLFFQGDTPAAAEQFAAADPYVKHQLVRAWQVRRWNTVVGDNPAIKL